MTDRCRLPDAERLERDRAILALADERRTSGWIAQHLGCPAKTVYNALTRLRKARGDRLKAWSDSDHPIAISPNDDARFSAAICAMGRDYGADDMTDLLRRVAA
ncbi:MAG: hypothetical protein FJ271_27465 [Planctomycetes bacterium]|nr:hypothetical protein [Planctomycetota bacterium]